MDLIKLQRRLLAAARLQEPSDVVPFAFERRVMARLESVCPEDGLVLWGRALWQAALGSLAVSLVLSVWLLLPAQGGSRQTNLAQVYDSTLYVAAEQLSDSW